MKKFVSVNMKYYKSSEINRISEHNNRESNIEYLLDKKDIKYENIDINYTKNNNSSDGFYISCGTYEQNLLQSLKNYKQNNPYNSKLLKYQFLKYQQEKKEICNKKGYYPNSNENELIEMVVAISEEQALYYLEKEKKDLAIAFDSFAKIIKDTYNLEPLNCSIHFDEGIKDITTGKVKLNIHAHITFMNFDFSKGKSVLRNLKKQDFRNMQDLAQEAFKLKDFDFIRGKSKEITTNKHLERNDFILSKQLQELEIIKKELKNSYTQINEQKNEYKTLRIKYDKTSSMYRILSTNIKNLQQQEKEKREEFRSLDKKLILLKQKMEVEEINIKNKNEWINEMKQDIKKFIKDSTIKNNSNKYEIRDINEFYNDLVATITFASNFDIKMEELKVLQNSNNILKNKIEELQHLNEKYQDKFLDLENLNKKITDLLDHKNQLEDKNYYLNKFLKQKDLECEFNDFLIKNDEISEKKFERNHYTI